MNTLAFRLFICRACGHVYDEAQGDPDGGLPPGTRLEDIPEDWACPLCGVTKHDFEPYDPAPRPAKSASLGRHAVVAGKNRHQPGVVIVGGGTAAWSLVEAIRSADADRPITLVAGCSADRYDKPRLSVAFRQGVSPQSLPTESGEAAAQRWGVRLMANTTAVGLNLAARRLRTTRGTITFDDLVLAHGAEPRACEALPPELCWRVNDLRAYAGLRQMLSERSRDGQAARAIIVGAGLVGSELANDLALAGHPVTLLDQAARLLPMAHPAQSDALLNAWAGLPISFVPQATVRAVVPRRMVHAESRCSSDGRRDQGPALPGVEVQLADGRTLQAEVLISAVGLQTPTRLAEQAGLSWDQGIAVDPESLSTGIPGVHALGDCISINGRPQRFIEPIRRQAMVVAARICGLKVPPYDAAPPPVRVKTSALPLTLDMAA